MYTVRKAKRKAARVGSDRKRLDSQQDALYEWETKWRDWNINSLTLSECRAAIRTACARYKVRPPAVKQHNLRSLSWSIPYPAPGWISLQAVGPRGRGGKNLATALHEAAHHIVYALFGNRPSDHGPTFLGIYIWLLVEAEVAPASALYPSARAAGLKWRHMPPTLALTMR